MVDAHSQVVTHSCTHDWETCPVHGRTDGELPAFRDVLACLYELGEQDADEVVEGVCSALKRVS